MDLARGNGVRFLNEGDEYRRARDALLAEEIELRRHIERVAEQRRALPPGGLVPKDYRLIGENGEVGFSALFGDKQTLAISYALLMRSVDIMNRSPETNRLLTGKCLCEAVHYVVRDEFVYALNCHCSNCRRATGSAFKPFAGIESTKLNITVGKENLLIFGEDHAHDAHCAKCGSLLYSVVREGAYTHVTMGTLVDSPTIRPTAHIFVGSKALWFTITDNLPQHKEFA